MRERVFFNEYTLILLIFFYLSSCINSRNENVISETGSLLEENETDATGPLTGWICYPITDHLSVEFTGFPEEILKSIITIRVNYFGLDSCIHTGSIDIAQDLADETVNIFNELFELRFPIDKIMTMDHFNWSDSLSMINNNTSGFNYRTISGQKQLSMHSFGRAIDINPAQNPCITKYDLKPHGAVYDPAKPGTIVAGSGVVKTFKKYGWRWGGEWKSIKDYQHFYKEPGK